MKLTLKNFMTPIAPINAMPFDEKGKKLEFAVKLGKKIPHPVIQKAAHTADLAIKAIKELKKPKTSKKIKNNLNSVTPE